DDPEVEARATVAFHRAARSVRQCLALEARLVRDAARFEHEAQERATRRADNGIERRRQHVRTAVARLIWTEADRPENEAEGLESELDDLLELERFSEAFLDHPVEVHIARLCRELGVEPPGEDGIPAAVLQAPPERRSSA
ncbi:MAG TPA: hypothetical protein VGC92_06280, partial [Phenylobacterium sp.]